MRVGDINPARMKGGEHPCEAGTAHGGHKNNTHKKNHPPPQKKIKNYKINHFYLHKLTFGAVFRAPLDTRGRHETAKGSGSVNA